MDNYYGRYVTVLARSHNLQSDAVKAMAGQVIVKGYLELYRILPYYDILRVGNIRFNSYAVQVERDDTLSVNNWTTL